MAFDTYALTNLKNLKSFLGVSGDGNNGLLESCINRASDMIERYCSRLFAARDYVGTDTTSGDYDPDNARLDGLTSPFNLRTLYLPQYPIVEITTVQINEVEYDETTSLYESGWFIEDAAAGGLGLRGYDWLAGRRNIWIDYNAGYGTIPDDLEEAALEQAGYLFKQTAPGGALLGVESRSGADGSVSYQTQTLLRAVKMILSPYRKNLGAY